jgi:membrane protein
MKELSTAALWHRGGLGWGPLARRVWRQFWVRQMPGRCAELAYYFLFAVFPLLLFLSTLLGYVAGANTRLSRLLFAFVARVAPSPDVTALLHTTLDQVSRERHGAQLWLSLVATVWVTSNAVLAVVRTLNAACGLRETRPWWRRRLLAIGLTVGFALLAAISLVLLLFGRELGEALADQYGMGAPFMATWHMLHWPAVLCFALLSFEAMYNYAPCREAGARHPWGTPGAVVGVLLWVGASFGLRLYRSAGYAATAYGSLGAVIVLLLWFYLTAVALVVGGDVNAEIERHPARPKRQAAGGSVVAWRRQRRREPRATR